MNKASDSPRYRSALSRDTKASVQLPPVYLKKLRVREKMAYGKAKLENRKPDESRLPPPGRQRRRNKSEDPMRLPAIVNRKKADDKELRKEILLGRARSFSHEREEASLDPAPAFRTLSRDHVDRIVHRMYTPAKAPSSRESSPDRQESTLVSRSPQEKATIWRRLTGDTMASKIRTAMTAFFAPDPYKVRQAGTKRGYW